MKEIKSKSYIRKISQFSSKFAEYGEMPNEQQLEQQQMNDAQNDAQGPYDSNDDQDDSNDDQGPFYVRVYRYSQTYGGPEEGGWWYDSNELVKEVIVNNKDEADMKREQLSAMYKDQGEDSYTQDLSRMSHPSDRDPMDDSDQTETVGFKGSTYESYSVTVETSYQAEHETTEVPHYR